MHSSDKERSTRQENADPVATRPAASSAGVDDDLERVERLGDPGEFERQQGQPVATDRRGADGSMTVPTTRSLMILSPTVGWSPATMTGTKGRPG